MYIFKDKELTEKQIAKFAEEKGVDVATFLANNPEVKGKKQPTTQEDAEIVDVTNASQENTESPSVDGSLESARTSVRSKTRKSDLSKQEAKNKEKAAEESKNLLNVIADVSEEDINSQVIKDYYNLDKIPDIFIPGPSAGVGAPGGYNRKQTIEEYLGPEKYQKYQADIEAGYVTTDDNNEKIVEELTSQAEFKVKKNAAEKYLRSVPESIQSKVNLDIFGEGKEFKSYEDAVKSINNLNNFVVYENKNIVKDKEEYALKTKPYTEKLNEISSKIKQLTGGSLSGEKLESFSDIEQYNALVLEAQEVAAEYDASGFDDVYSSLIDRQEAFNIAIQNINSKEYKDKLDNIQNAKIAEDALSLDYSFTTRTAINLEEFFVGNTVNFGSLTAQLGLELLSAANPLAMFNDEGLKKIDRGIEIIKESTRDYNKELAKKREETLPESIKLDDIGSNKVGYFDWFKEATADNSATILTTFIPGGLAAKGAAGVRAATTVAAKKAALQAQKKFALAGMRTAQGVFFVAESGGKFKELSTLEDNGLKNYSFAQKAFTSYAFGVTATLAETFGSLRLIQGGKQIAKDLGKKQFKVNAYKKPLNFSGTVVGKTLNGLTPLVTKAMPIELFEESITQVSHNALDVWVLDEKKSFLEGLNKDFFASTALTSFAIMSPKTVGNTVNIIKNEFRTKDEIFKNQDRVKELVQLQSDIPNLKGESLKLARSRKKEIIEELGLEDALSIQKLNSMSYEDILKVSEIKTMQRLVAEDMYALGRSGDVTELGKKAKQNLQTQYEQLQSQADALLNTKKVKIQQSIKALRESLGVEFTNLNAEYHLGLFDFYQDAAMTLMPKDGEYIVVEDISKIEEQLKGKVSDGALSEIKKGFEQGSNAVNIGNSIIINKKAVEQNIASSTFNSDGKFSAASPIHELFHIYNKGKNIVDKNGELSESATKAVDEAIELLNTKKELGEISEKDYNDLINRFNLYKKGKGKVVLKSGKRGKAGVDSEEILAAMNDAVSLGIIKPSDMISVPGLKELILGIAKDVFGQANWMFSLETSNDVFNFIKDYQKSVEESVSVQLPEDEDEQKIKESRIVSPQATTLKDLLTNEELVESIKSPTTEDKFSVAQAIVEKNWPVISKQIDFTPTQQDTAKEVVEEQILGVFQGSGQGKYSPRNTGLFNAFDSSVAQVNTYLGKTIASRKPEIDLAIKERAGVTGQDLSKAEGITVVESTPAPVDTKKIKPSSLLPSDIVSKVKKEVKEKLKDVPADKLTFKKLGNLAPEIIAEAIGIPVKKLTDATANLSKSDASAIQRFISQKPETLIKLLPEGAVLEAATQKLMGTSTGVPKSLLDAFYTKQDRTTDPSGLYPFKLNSNLNRANFLEAFGIVDGKKAKDFSPRSAEAQRLKGIASLFGRLVTNEIARTEGDLSLETSKDVAAGKSRLMFSKTAETALDRPLFELEEKVVDELLEKYNQQKTFKYKTKEQVDEAIKEIEKELLPLMPKDFWFGKPDSKGNYGTAFTPSSKVFGTTEKAKDLYKNYWTTEIKKLRNLPDSAFGKKIPGINDFSKSSYSTIFKNEATIKKNIKNGNIDKFNDKVGKIHEALWKRIYDKIQNNPKSATVIANYLKMVGSDTSHWHKLGAKFVGYSKNPSGRYEYEHAMPATAAYLYLLDASLSGANFNAAYAAVMDNYKLIALDKVMDKKLTAVGLQRKMPKGWKLLDNFWWQRYFNEEVAAIDGGIPTNSLIFLNGKDATQELKVDSAGNATTPAIQKSVSKASKSNNKILPSDFRLTGDFNNQAVLDRMAEIDNISQEAELKFSKSLDLNKDFNDIIENKTGIASDKTYARVKAEVAGANKGRFNFFIPPSAEDFVGLLYSTLGKGDVGTAQMAWYKAHLLNPFARAMENLANDRVSMMQDYRGLKKALKIVPKDLRKKIKDSNFTKEQAVRVAIWDKQGMVVPGLSQKDQKELVDYVNADAELTVFAEQLIDINKGDEYASPDAGWVAGTIDTDFIKALNTTKRSKYLETWQQNADIIFSEANLNKLEAAYGKPYRVALENMLHRMKTGRNRSFGTDTITSRFTDWLTNSVGAIMFFNTRSAVLQTISAVNFINFTDNNVLKAGLAFANQPQYWSDFKKLFNSPFLLDRRSGIKLNVNEADIAEMAKGPGNSARNVVAGLLKLGFLPTQIADSFAIASGGATFYRNRIKALKKEGLTEAEAEEIAFRDFREIAEESQQSSRPDKISQQQAGPLGRIVLAFANTPAQYARLIKKAASDLKNGRGDAKTNISKIIYYGVAQNLLFSALQQALFAIGFGDEDEEEEKRNKKYFDIANGMADSILRGIGVGGAVVSVVKNTAIRLAKEADKKAPKYQDAVVKGVLQISPPVSSKVGKLQSAGRSFSWNQEEMKTMGFNIDNPAYLASAQVISAVTNVPLDRAIKKITNIKDAGDENIEYYKRVALALGWSAWELGIKKDSKGKVKKVEPKTDMDKLYDLNKKQQIDSLLSLGLSKKQIKALKLEEDRVKAILDPKSVKTIKVSKRDSLFGLNKKDQVKALEKLGFTKKEIRALRLESDRVEAIINKQKQEN